MIFLFCFFIRSLDCSINYGQNSENISLTKDDPYIRLIIPQIDYDPDENFDVPSNYSIIILNNKEFIDKNNNPINIINVRPRNEKYFTLKAISPNITNKILYIFFDVDTPNPIIIFNSNSSQYQVPNVEIKSSLYFVSEGLYNYRLDTNGSIVNVSFAYKLLTNYKTSGIADFQTTFVRMKIGESSNVNVSNIWSWVWLGSACDYYNTGEWIAYQEFPNITTYYIRFTGESKIYLDSPNYNFVFQPLNEGKNHVAFFMTKDILKTETDEAFHLI